MSIITKVSILFLISLSLMLFVSNKTEQLTQETLESLLKEKYIQVSDELFGYLADNDISALNKKLQELKLSRVENKEHNIDASKVLYQYESDLSSIKILEDEDNKFLLHMSYLDDDILVVDRSQNKNFQEMEFVNYLILADILILVILFLIILKMIYPLKNIAKNIKEFGDGEYSKRVYIVSNDEIADVAKTFNMMATNIEELILSREALLRDMGHELKTPIAKSKIALEMIEDSKYKEILSRALSQIDEMVSELLDLEKLNANRYELKKQKFSCETLISESLARLYIEDETLVDVSIKSNFEIDGDLNYLITALKNLIDNALKYSTSKPIFVVAEDENISVKSKGEKLEKPLKFYCEAFTQGDNSRNQVGYGLGLSLVKRVLDRHEVVLLYGYDNGYNIFSINFKKPFYKVKTTYRTRNSK